MDHALPPVEVKLYALGMAGTIHDWAKLAEICAIVVQGKMTWTRTWA